jgi:hypothetical protein
MPRSVRFEDGMNLEHTYIYTNMHGFTVDATN